MKAAIFLALAVLLASTANATPSGSSWSATFSCLASVDFANQKLSKQLPVIVSPQHAMNKLNIGGDWSFIDRSTIHQEPGALEFVIENEQTGQRLVVFGNDAFSHSMDASVSFGFEQYVTLICNRR